MAIGVFDGVHRGHQELIRRAAKRAHQRGARATRARSIRSRSGARPGWSAFGLSDIDERTRLLHDAGADDVIVFHFTEQFAAMTPDDFIGRIVGGARSSDRRREGLPVRARARGYRAHAHRRGTDKFGFEVFVAPPVLADGELVSSTRIRNAVLAGDVASATRLLGRPYMVRGTLAPTAQRGRGLGFPTIDSPSLRNACCRATASMR